MILFVYIIFCKEKGKEYLRLDYFVEMKLWKITIQCLVLWKKGHALIEIIMAF